LIVDKYLYNSRYFHSLQAIGVDPEKEASAAATDNSSSASASSSNSGAGVGKPSVADPSRVFFGTSNCYVFFRLHHTLFNRLSAAREMAEVQYRALTGRDDHGNIEESPEGMVNVVPDASGRVYTKRHCNEGLNPPYQTFLSELIAHLEGAIDTARYEECCRQVLGNHAYLLYTLDKIVQHTVKTLQAMVNDEMVNKMIGLFVYHRSKDMKAVTGQSSSDIIASGKVKLDTPSIVDTDAYQAHVARMLPNSNEEIYRIQLVSRGSIVDGGSEYVACQCLGTLSPTGVPTVAPAVTPFIPVPDSTGADIPNANARLEVHGSRAGSHAGSDDDLAASVMADDMDVDENARAETKSERDAGDGDASSNVGDGDRDGNESRGVGEEESQAGEGERDQERSRGDDAVDSPGDGDGATQEMAVE
jgi:C-terminal domain of Sin3a protein